MEHVETDDVRAGWQDFEWIADLYKSPCFTTCETSKPATSSDFGCDGLTASLTDWHELLQVTAPDVNCGLVFVRGRFPNAPGAILARAQKPNYRGSKDLFGTRSVRAELDSDLELGQKKAQGWVNFRWPYVHYELKRKGDDSDSSGTYEQISFVRKGTLLQVTRIKWGHGSSLSDYGPDDAPDKQTIRIRSGGRIRFGCPCSNRLVPDVDSYDLNVVNHDDTRLNCVSKKYQKRLEMQVVINGSPQNLRPRRQPAIQDGAETIDMSSIHQVELSVGEPTYIVSALALREENDLSNPIDGGHFEHVQDYLGVERASLNMTDRLWTALCSTNYEAGEAVEFSAVGRCVEQIIGVASIPFSRQSLMQSIFNSQVGKVRDDAGGIVKEIALVQNIMAPQFVDVQSAFYQIRLLTKVYNFISTKHLEPDILEHMQPLDSIRVSYLQMLRHVLLSTVVWLVNTNFRRSRLLPAIKSWDATSQSPASIERLEACENHRVHMTFDQSYNRSCYATLAVWYVMRHCPDAITEKFKNSVLLPSLYNAFQSVQERATRGTEPTPKNDTLQWYHMSCLYLICCQQFGVDEQGNPMDAFALRPGELDRQEILYMQRRFQKFASRLKAGHDGNYSARHEELDRVILLGEELGLQDIHDSPTTFSQATSRAQQTRRRIIERKRTTRFNPGHGPARHLTHTSNGPWELLCTNHEIYLQVAEEMSVTSARNRTFEFLTSDYSFVSSWDCSDSDWISKWWNVETASIVCATLLHLRDEGKLNPARVEFAHESMENPTRRQLTGTDTNANNSAPQTERLSDRATLDAFLQFKELLTHDTTRSSNSIRPFEWLRRKPNKEHHPDWWTNSLDDTPEMYRTKQTRDVHLRKELVKYLRYRKRQDIVDNAIYTASNIESKISALDLRYLCCFDLCFTNRDGFQVQNVKLEQEAEESRVHNLPQMQSHRTRLFKRLNDSLVDLDIRHRILFARQCTPALVGSMIYLWHPQFLDGIDNYFGAVSRFTENSEGMSWTTSITLSHWKLSSIQLVDDDLALFKENRSSGDFPPNTIAKLGTTKKQLKGPGFLQNSHKLEERSSSLVITGDLTGNMWICSLLSSLTDSEALDTLINDSTCRTLQRFIHQQSTGRCLVFLMLLGHLCEKLAIEYEAVLTQLDVIVGLGEEVLLQGIDWGSSQALEKLKKMLWGLEALRAFGERLSASLAQIQRAKEAMERVGKKDAGYLHVDLLQEYQQVIEEFTKRYDILSDVDMRTKLKIKQVTGLRDGISTVTNVEDSQATLNNAKITVRQGNNIRTLTYITIAYLPLGFVTGLFSVQHAHFMDAATDAHFAGLTVLFVLVTYSIALFLQNIIDQMAHIVEKWRDGKPDHLPMRQPGEAERTGRRRTSWIRWLWVRLNPSNEDEKSSGST